MDITKKHQRNNFTMVSNIARNDANLSLKAKGLIFYLMGLPDGWSINVKELTRHCSDGETAMRATINELIKAGYMRMIPQRNERGQIAGTLWEYSDEPIFLPNMEKPNEDTPHLENPHTGNRNIYNIYKEDNTDGIKSGGENEFSHTPTPAPDKNFNSVSELDAAQPYQWVEEKKENSAKEKKTLFENSELYKSLAVFNGGTMDADATLANLEKKFTNVPDNVDLLYYFGAVARWSNSSNTKRTSRGWKSTIENFICGDVEKKKLHTKINQDKDKSDIDLMNLFNKF